MILRLTLRGMALCLLVPAAGIDAQAPPTTCQELAVLSVGIVQDTIPACRVALAQADPRVSLLGATLPQAALLTSWALFVPAADSMIVVGQIAIENGNLDRVSRSLVQSGYRLIAVHRHMVGETPAISFVHFSGRGEARALAMQIRQSIGPPIRSGIVAAAENVVGQRGVVTGIPCDVLRNAVAAEDAETGPGFCAVRLPWRGAVTAFDGVPLNGLAEMSNVFAFREAAGRAITVMTGQIVVEADRVPAVVAGLMQGGIDIAAMHAPSVAVPGLRVIHVQARGNPLLLAEALRSVIDAR